jgi:uncharacterized membrane protein YccC
VRARAIEGELTNQIAQQNQHQLAQIANRELQYKTRLRKQHREIQRLTTMLDELAASAAKLRSSRFWRFANRMAALEAKLFRKKSVVPERCVQKLVTNYQRWRASQPANANPDAPTDPDESPVPGESSNVKPARLSETQRPPKISGNSANE